MATKTTSAARTKAGKLPADTTSAAASKAGRLSPYSREIKRVEKGGDVGVSALALPKPTGEENAAVELPKAASANISIHAPREEGDTFRTSTTPPGLFQSTPPARRATANGWTLYRLRKISIHAPREEGDSKNRQYDAVYLSIFANLFQNRCFVTIMSKRICLQKKQKYINIQCEPSGKFMCTICSHSQNQRLFCLDGRSDAVVFYFFRIIVS